MKQNKRTKPPKNSAKQILKLFKHFYDPVERWWEAPMLGGSFLSVEKWREGAASLAQVSNIPREDWNEEELFEAVKLTNTGVYSAFKKKKQLEYRSAYQSIIEQAIQEALEDSQRTGRYFLGQLEFNFYFKALTSITISERKAPVLSDCYISRSGVVVFLKTKTYFSPRGRFPKEIRSAYRSGYAPLRGSRMRLAWYYRDKSDHNRILFSFQLRTTEDAHELRIVQYGQYLLEQESSFDNAFLLAGLGGLIQKWDAENPILSDIRVYLEHFQDEIAQKIISRSLLFCDEISLRLERGEWFDLIFHSCFIELGGIEFLQSQGLTQEHVIQKLNPRWKVLAPFSRSLLQIYPLQEGDLQHHFLRSINSL